MLSDEDDGPGDEMGLANLTCDGGGTGGMPTVVRMLWAAAAARFGISLEGTSALKKAVFWLSSRYLWTTSCSWLSHGPRYRSGDKGLWRVGSM